MEESTTNTTKDVYTCTSDNAAKVWGWLRDRGGIAVWRSVNLSNPGASWTTPAMAVNGGGPITKPTWEAADKPERVITDPAMVMVSVDKEVKRFRVGVRVGGQGMTLKVTDGGTRKIRAAVAAAGEGAYYQFDYETQEAVIMAPSQRPIPITEWIEQHAATSPHENGAQR